MLLQPAPVDVPKTAQEDAASLGINIPGRHSPDLSSGNPTPQKKPTHTTTRTQNAHRRRFDSDGPLTYPHRINKRSAEQPNTTTTSQRLFKPNRQLQGYDWYDAMTKTTDYCITVSDENGDHNLLFARRTNAAISPRPDRIEFTVQTDSQGEKTDIQLPTDLAFEKADDPYMEAVSPLVTQDSEISAQELVEIMKLAFFTPSDDKDADSYDTQEENHETAYSMTAISLLESEDQAIINSVIATVQRHILYQIPDGSTATIRVSRQEPTRVTISRDE